MPKFLIITAAAALTVSLSACGDDPEDDPGVDLPKSVTASAAPSGGRGPESDALTPEQLKEAEEFVACMREAGYDMPAPSDPEFEYEPRDAGDFNEQQRQKVRADSAKCDKEVGVDVMTGR